MVNRWGGEGEMDRNGMNVTVLMLNKSDLSWAEHSLFYIISRVSLSVTVHHRI